VPKRTKFAVVATTAAVLALASSASAQAPIGAQLAQVRAATAKYHNVSKAIADGYVQVSPCVSSPAGGMGVHYRKNALLNGQVNALTPEVLVYQPMKNGKLRLVAVEYFEFATAVNNTAPTVLGQTFVGPETHGIPAHFELHVWLWKHNPSGMFAQWNPRVVCPS